MHFRVNVPAVTALSSGLRVQEVAGSRDLNPAKPPELGQVVVTGDDRLGSGGEGALEDSMDEDGEGADGLHRLSRARR